MKYLFTFSFNLTGKTGENYTAVHGFSVENPNNVDDDPYEFVSQMEDKWRIVHDGSGEILSNIDINGFTTYEAESSQIMPIMKDWHDHFVTLGFRCSRVHFLGILSETGRQNFTEEDYLGFHEKWSTETVAVTLSTLSLLSIPLDSTRCPCYGPAVNDRCRPSTSHKMRE